MMLAFKKPSLIIFFFLIYSVIFYLMFNNQVRMDFTTFYSAALAFSKHQSPYVTLYSTYLPIPQKLPMNLTPPIFLMLLQPLTLLTFPVAAVVWMSISLLLGLTGAVFLIHIIFKEPSLQKDKYLYLIIFLAFYPTLANTAIGQVGNLLFFLIMGGYYFYLKKKDWCCGLCWGLIIAIKFFPGLLLFMMLYQKRYRALYTTLLITTIASALPILTHGIDNYFSYVNLLSRVLWYGDSWNASFYGFLFRFIDRADRTQSFILIKSVYLIFFLASLYWTIKQYRHATLPHYAFCITLIMMLLMSPLGWIYYFPILLCPLIITFKQLYDNPNDSILPSLLWLIGFFMINFPRQYLLDEGNISYFVLFTNYSFACYSLLILLYLVYGLNVPSSSSSKQTVVNPNSELLTQRNVVLILVFGLVLSIYEIMSQLTNTLTLSNFNL